MVFSSALFLVYFLPALLTLHYLVGQRGRKPVLLAASVFFYAWGAPRFVFVVLLATALDFQFVRWLHAAPTARRRRLWLLASLSLNLGLLGYFKYAGFLVENANAALGALGFASVPFTSVALPLGLSFYTFETITYVVDVYRGVQAPLSRLRHYLLYILFFPKLIAGPIVRYGDLAAQLEAPARGASADAFLTGFYRFTLGLGKKVLIANVLGLYADAAFRLPPEALDAGSAWLGALAYTLQIYFDFAGYSDMALGLARMLGFELPENFRDPFVSTSLTEFWTRWHISLGTWMRHYLYVPLGGNRVGRPRLYLNLVLVFLVSGLWHGAAWSFLVWGAYHGAFLLCERAGLLRRVRPALGRLATALLVTLGFVLFRNLGPASTLRYCLALVQPAQGFALPPGREFVFSLTLALLFACWAIRPAGVRAQAHVYAASHTTGAHLALFPASLALFVLSLARIAWSPFNPFLYFRF